MKRADRFDSLFRYYGTRESVPWRVLKARAIAEIDVAPEGPDATVERFARQLRTSYWNFADFLHGTGFDDRVLLWRLAYLATDGGVWPVKVKGALRALVREQGLVPTWPLVSAELATVEGFSERREQLEHLIHDASDLT